MSDSESDYEALTRALTRTKDQWLSRLLRRIRFLLFKKSIQTLGHDTKSDYKQPVNIDVRLYDISSEGWRIAFHLTDCVFLKIRPDYAFGWNHTTFVAKIALIISYLTAGKDSTGFQLVLTHVACWTRIYKPLLVQTTVVGAKEKKSCQEYGFTSNSHTDPEVLRKGNFRPCDQTSACIGYSRPQQVCVKRELGRCKVDKKIEKCDRKVSGLLVGLLLVLMAGLYAGECYKRTNWNDVLDSLDWMDMLSQEKLEAQKKLPDQKQLNKLLEIFFRAKSNASLHVIKYVEDLAQTYVKKKYPTAKKVWLAYKYNNGNGKSGVIMIDAKYKKNAADLPLETCVYTTCDVSEEARKIIDYCEKHQTDYSDSSEELIAARKFINENAKKLMTDHRFLSIIKPSPVRSKGFNSSDHIIKEENCIALYVLKKGYIPVTEKPFPERYGGLKTDVREGAFYTCMQTDRENIDTLKMGLKITRNLPNSQPSDTFGTLGGFLEHPEYGTCAITSAHVLLNENEMAMLEEKHVLSWLDLKKSDTRVYLCNDARVQIGRFVKAVYAEGNVSNTGYEAAIFQIDEDLQTAGKFWNETVKAEDEEHSFTVGKVHSTLRLGTSSRILKFGATTGRTDGKFITEIPNISIKLQSDRLPESIVLNNQIEIKGNNESNFSENGDSGSLVMIKRANGDTSCVGILVGATDHNTTIVSPIGPILEIMNVSSLKCFQQDQLLDDVQNLKTDVKSLKTDIKTILELLQEKK